MKRADWIIDEMAKWFPHAHCELNHETPFQLAVAVVLSAQTTDAAVNTVTPALFHRFPTSALMAKSTVQQIEPYIARLGLYHNKAKSILGLATVLEEKYHGIMPTSMKDLTSLPGVGRKSANVIRSVCFDIPSFAVDTHVARISKRLRLAKPEDNVEVIETKLKRKISKEKWNMAHHTMIFWGRYKCKAQHPDCNGCPFQDFCRTYRNEF